MDSLYHITTSGSSLPVKDSGGEITFTVTNATADTQQTRFETRLDGDAKASGAKAEWLSVEQPLRTMATKSVEQVKVKLSAPPGAVADFAFRLYAVALPVRDEQYTAGPSIACSLKKKDAPPPPPPAKWWIFVVAAVVLLMLGGGVYYLLSRPKGVPKVTGMKIEEARAALEKAGLKVSGIRYQPSASADGTVLDQQPAGGAEAPADKAVKLTVAGFLEVPAVVGLGPAAAKAALEAIGLVAAPPVPTPSAPAGVQAGTIAAQNPGAGKRVAPGTRVNLLVYVP